MKMDCFQPAASFKIRGMGRSCRLAVERGARRLICSSGGNAGYAVAWAARALGVKATVVVPRTTPEFMRAKIRAVDAEVIEHGEDWDDAHASALELARACDAAYIHPFDDPETWEGHATIIEEVSRQGPKPGAVVVCVGGGGLLCGLLLGMHRIGWDDVPVLAVATDGAASFLASVTAGRRVTLEAILSLATTLGARTVTPRLLQWKTEHEILHWTATDRQAVDGCLRFADDHRILVEPSCGASLAAIYERREELSGRGPVLIEICGGGGVSLELLRRWDREAL